MSDDGRKFRAAKQRVATDILKPAQFVKGPREFVRHINGQFHGIDFQTSQFASLYYVNIGFHYDFLPAALALANGTKQPEYWEFHGVDFLFRTRLDCLMRGKYPHEFRYDVGDASKVQKQLEDNARNAIAALDRLGNEWREPRVLLGALPPRVLEEQKRLDAEEEEMLTEESSKAPPSPLGKLFGIQWLGNPSILKLGCWLCEIALRENKMKLAREYLSIAKTNAGGFGGPTLRKLQEKIRGIEK